MNVTTDIARIDGCRVGWIVATTDGAILLPTLELQSFGRIGVDMPIGLVDVPPRACAIEARRFLGQSASASVSRWAKSSASASDS